MNFHDCMKSAIDYIEANLDNGIDYDMVAQKACCSSYHFQRMFSYIVGVSLADYIRLRRMTLAAFDLQASNVKVIDLAAKYGYDSQSSFARAFQSFHGLTPSSARDVGTMLKAYPRVSFQVLLQGAQEMNYRIEKTEPFSLFGIAIQLTAEDTRMENIFDKIGLYADEVLENGSHDATNVAAGQPLRTLLTAVRFGFQPDGSYKFMFAAKLPDHPIDDKFTILCVPATTWAVFDYNAVIYPETPEPLFKSIYSEWFPTSDYEQAAGPCFERFRNGRMEAWIPVQRKS